MKSYLSLIVVGVLLVFGCAAVRAQSAPAPTSSEPAAAPSSVLTSDEKERLAKVRQQALAENPDLKAEHDVLTQEGQLVKKGTPEEKAAFMDKVMVHQQKMKAAMLKVDPTIGPLLEKVDATLKAVRERMK